MGVEKIVKVPVKVDDVMGLLIDLKKSGFAALNVGSDPVNTYVYLDPSEEKDPTSIVESWAGRPTPPLDDKEAWAARGADIEALPKIWPTAPKPSILSRIFRKIMG